ncbi:hypothetical protein PR048_019960 [Dryococelus australis]|uniref:YqaJ viral recombinase domain-containing protein n=1 Tax=Dryococelus australis TaxID=614101 RepID=A0ABQ9H4Z5_9NEOP|nr:hypothetical protein PR048_019960 [Dryococelus australis]
MVCPGSSGFRQWLGGSTLDDVTPSHAAEILDSGLPALPFLSRVLHLGFQHVASQYTTIFVAGTPPSWANILLASTSCKKRDSPVESVELNDSNVSTVIKESVDDFDKEWEWWSEESGGGLADMVIEEDAFSVPITEKLHRNRCMDIAHPGPECTSHKEEYADDINDAAVWGAMSTGIGYSKLKEMFTTMDFPVMSSEKLSKHEYAIEHVGASDHIIGFHERCRSTFCNRKDSEEENFIPKLETSGLLQPIRDLIAKLEKKTDKLVTNRITNAAERYIVLNTTFTGAIQINFDQRESYSDRCHGAALSHTSDPSWHSSPWKTMHSRSLGSTCKNLCQKSRAKSSKRKLNYQEDVAQKKRRKVGGGPDRTMAKLREQADINTKRETIEMATRGQHDNEKWHEMCMNHLTASNFGAVVLSRNHTPCHSFVRNVLYPKDLNMPAVLYGRIHESQTLAEYNTEKGVHVTPYCLLVSADDPFLSATSDGLVSDDGLVEVKCLPSVKDKLLLDVCRDKKSSICLTVKGGLIHLKRNHIYYYHVQKQQTSRVDITVTSSYKQKNTFL